MRICNMAAVTDQLVREKYNSRQKEWRKELGYHVDTGAMCRARLQSIFSREHAT